MSTDHKQQQTQSSARFYCCSGLVVAGIKSHYSAAIMEARSAAEAEGGYRANLREKHPSADDEGWIYYVNVAEISADFIKEMYVKTFVSDSQK